MHNAPSALCARDLTFRRGAAVLVADVCFSLEPGEVLGVLGPNGAGKSTLMRLVSGELKPTSGEVSLSGERVADLSARTLAKRRAVVTQACPLSFAFTVLEVVLLGASVPGLGAGALGRQAAADALNRVGLEMLLGRPYTALSGGERQRVHIARAFCQLALARHAGTLCPILLLDEPISSQDIGHQRLVLDAVRAEAARGAAVLTVIHDLNLAAAYCDRVMLMREGKVLRQGDPADVLESQLLSEAYGCKISVNCLPSPNIPFVLPVTQ